MKLLVIGAGIGGLTLALLAARRGFDVQVFELSPDLAEIGAGLTVYPNGARVLDAAGVGDAFREAAVVPRVTGLIHYQTGELLMKPLGESGAAPNPDHVEYRVHRADLHQILAAELERVAPGAVRLNKGLSGIYQDGNKATALFKDGSSANGDVLVGCDGIRSVTRNALLGPTKPIFTGNVAWRGLVPVDRLPPAVLDHDSAVWVGPGHQFVRYLVRRRTVLNFVAFGLQPGWEVESWTEPASKADLLREFDGWNQEVLSIIQAADESALFKWALFDRDPLPYWSVGRATLLGDAAHPMLPFLGQGAGMALEDAMILVRCLEADAEPEDALRRYDRARRPRASMVTLLARENGIRIPEGEPEVLPASPEDIERRKRINALFAYDAVSEPV